MGYPRQGAGVDMHCVDVGLEDPQAKKVVAKAQERFVVTPSDLVSVKLGNAIEQKDFRTVAEAAKVVDGIDSMVTKYSSQPSAALKNISLETAKTNPMWAEQVEKGKTSRLMEAEMISGQAEGQLLQLLIGFGKVKKVLDIGTFTGYSSLAMAEALPTDGTVITLEREQEAADMAKENWKVSEHASKITLVLERQRTCSRRSLRKATALTSSSSMWTSQDTSHSTSTSWRAACSG